MSTYYWEKRQRSQNIPITSIRCLVEALTTSSIQLTNVPVEVHNLIHAEQSYAEALAAYEQSSLTSLDDVKTMQANIEALIAANETLHEALITAENKLPETVEFQEQRCLLHRQACGRFLPHHVDGRGSDLQRSRNRTNTRR